MTQFKKKPLVPAGAILLLVSLYSGLAAQTDAGVDELPGLADFVVEVLNAHGVPSASVTVVSDDRVIYQRGHGLADVAEKRPTSTSTVFPLASISKTFTATAASVLVERDLLDWNQPIQDIAPWFKLNDPYATRHATITDLLSHQTGMGRHDFAWFGGTLSRTELLERMEHLEFAYSFRERFNYNNIVFTAGGVVCGELYGSGWDALIEESLLEPLRMMATTTRFDDFIAYEDRALGYRRDRNGSLREVQYINTDVVGPAGSISSNAEDIARWLRFLLGNGTIDGTEVVAPTHLHHTMLVHAPIRRDANATVLQDRGYGIGWNIAAYRNKPLIYHNGGINGFSSRISVLPDCNAGAVVMTNGQHGGPVVSKISRYLYDRICGFEPSVSVDAIAGNRNGADDVADSATRKMPPSSGQSSYTGRYYNPGYDTLRIFETNTGLKIRLTTIDYDLIHDAHDYFYFWDGQEIVGDIFFKLDKNGVPLELEIPFYPGMDPVRFLRLPPEELVDPDYLSDFVGTFQSAHSDQTLDVSLDGETLHYSRDGGGLLELIPVTNAVFRRKSNWRQIVVTFTGDHESNYDTMSIAVPGQTERVFRRIKTN